MVFIKFTLYIGPKSCRSTIADAVATFSMQCSWFDPIRDFTVEFKELNQLPMFIELLNTLAQSLKDDKYDVLFIIYNNIYL